MQTKFKNKDAFLEWRAYWKRQYLGSARTIRYYKKVLKTSKDQRQTNYCRMLLRREQIIARNMMIAREAIISDYRVRCACNRASHKVMVDENTEVEIAELADRFYNENVEQYKDFVVGHGRNK